MPSQHQKLSPEAGKGPCSLHDDHTSRDGASLVTCCPSLLVKEDLCLCRGPSHNLLLEGRLQTPYGQEPRLVLLPWDPWHLVAFDSVGGTTLFTNRSQETTGAKLNEVGHHQDIPRRPPKVNHAQLRSHSLLLTLPQDNDHRARKMILKGFKSETGGRWG
ncbi:uncharacterized protein [Oryctolagus cuniculus]|uniref:uncharacterized protein isoform X1 n=1 Tax=Oryctolagus cuniculus TaxID=9986 RepID=UPI00222E26D6|nr:uncharacterized protein LOC108176820 isoform X3 [Oryctolagus cuniculus]